jgi:hypothetical protein
LEHHSYSALTPDFPTSHRPAPPAALSSSLLGFLCLPAQPPAPAARREYDDEDSPPSDGAGRARRSGGRPRLGLGGCRRAGCRLDSSPPAALAAAEGAGDDTASDRKKLEPPLEL